MYCILITGIPASGKSTLASVLSDRLHIPMLSKDSIKELLFDDIGFHSRAEKVALGAAAQNVLYYAARQLLRSGTPFLRSFPEPSDCLCVIPLSAQPVPVHEAQPELSCNLALLRLSEAGSEDHRLVLTVFGYLSGVSLVAVVSGGG